MESVMKHRIFHPTKSFEDMLFALVALLLAKGWSFAGVSIDQLAADAEAQLAERTAQETLMGQFRAQREAFSLNQAERYERFMAAINAARGAFGNDPVVMAELDRFKRPPGRPRKAKEEAEVV
jgi:hypothetical protein